MCLAIKLHSSVMNNKNVKITIVDNNNVLQQKNALMIGKIVFKENALIDVNFWDVVIVNLDNVDIKNLMENALRMKIVEMIGHVLDLNA